MTEKKNKYFFLSISKPFLILEEGEKQHLVRKQIFIFQILFPPGVPKFCWNLLTTVIQLKVKVIYTTRKTRKDVRELNSCSCLFEEKNRVSPFLVNFSIFRNREIFSCNRCSRCVIGIIGLIDKPSYGVDAFSK